MTLIPVGNGLFVGLSGDRPTAGGGIGSGIRFTDVNTGAQSYWNGSIWVQIGLMVNVRDYGATGDGTTNDSTSFTSTLAAVPTSGGTIWVPAGHYRVDNFTINRDNIHVLGEGWGSVIQPTTIGADAIRIDLSGSQTSRTDIVIQNLYIKSRGTGTGGHGVTNKHSGSLFLSGQDTNLDNSVIEHCLFTDYASGKNAIDLRNVDNKLLIRHNRFRTINGKDIYIEANGRAGGNITIEDNALVHGVPLGCIELRAIATNIKRTNIVKNTIVCSAGSGNNVPAILIQNDTGLIEHVNIWGNTVEDARFCVDIGGSGAGVVSDVKINNNWFFHRANPAESGGRAVILRPTSRSSLVENNYYEGVSGTIFIPVEDLGSTAPVNIVREDIQNFVNCLPFTSGRNVQTITSGSQIAGAISGSPSFQGAVIFSGSTNLPRPPAQVIITKEPDGHYLVQRYDGFVIYSGSTFESGLQPAISSGGNTYINDGVFTFSSGFNGIDFPLVPIFSRLQMDYDTHLVVPNNYSGYVFRMLNTSGASQEKHSIIGGTIEESGSLTRRWTAIRFHATGNNSNGISRCTIRETSINWADRGIHFLNDESGTSCFVNTNYIENITMKGINTFIDFDMQTAYISLANGFHRNTFQNILMQRTGPTSTSHGIKDIRHTDNRFIGMYTADFVDPQTTATIHTNASDTVIIGGSMTALNFVDNSTTQSTFIADQTKRVWFTRHYAGTLDMQANVSGGNTTLSIWDSPPERDSRLYIQRNDTNDRYDIRVVKANTSGKIWPVVFQMQDVATVTTLEPMRFDISGNTILNLSGGRTVLNQLSGLNWVGSVHSGKTDTAGNSGFFAPLGYMQQQVSGVTVKVPYFAA